MTPVDFLDIYSRNGYLNMIERQRKGCKDNK